MSESRKEMDRKRGEIVRKKSLKKTFSYFYFLVVKLGSTKIMRKFYNISTFVLMYIHNILYRLTFFFRFKD